MFRLSLSPRRLLNAAATALCIAGATPAAATEMGEIYIAGFGGYALSDDYDIDFVDSSPEVDQDGSATVGIAVGYGAWDDIRFEVEGSFTGADAEVGFFRGDIDADIDEFAIAFNVYRDIALIPDRLDLYIGGGLGLNIRDFDLEEETDILLIRADADPNNLQPGDIVDEVITDGGTTLSFQAQILTGVAVHLTESLSLTGGYRGVFVSDDNSDDLPIGSTFRSSFEAGLRWTF